MDIAVRYRGSYLLFLENETVYQAVYTATGVA